MSNLSAEQGFKLFATNCVHGKNYADDYQECVEKAETEVAKGRDFQEVVEEIKTDLRTKYDRT